MIIQVYDDDLLNGEGIREVVYLQGCPHHCKGCFNPETWEFKPNTKETNEISCRWFMHLEHKLSQIYISGITITGGEPLVESNVKEAEELARLTKEKGKSVWIYTGYTWDKVKNLSIMKYVDVLCEGPYIESLKSPSKPWVGSENQRVIDVQKSLKEKKICLKQ